MTDTTEKELRKRLVRYRRWTRGMIVFNIILAALLSTIIALITYQKTRILQLQEQADDQVLLLNDIQQKSVATSRMLDVLSGQSDQAAILFRQRSFKSKLGLELYFKRYGHRVEKCNFTNLPQSLGKIDPNPIVLEYATISFIADYVDDGRLSQLERDIAKQAYAWANKRPEGAYQDFCAAIDELSPGWCPKITDANLRRLHIELGAVLLECYRQVDPSLQYPY